MNNRIYADRREAGRALVPEIKQCELNEPIVLGLPRGGIPVAFEVATAIDALLDVLVVRKLGAPFQPELAIGAIASGDIRVLNEDLIREVPGIDDAVLEEIVVKEKEELERRESLYRGNRAYPELRDRNVIVIDDGIATGATMRAAAQAIRSRDPAKLLIAVPTAPIQAVRLLEKTADQVISLDTPAPFFAVGNYYVDFGQTTDDEVRRLLREAWEARPAA